jgi:hypothetical protein
MGTGTRLIVANQLIRAARLQGSTMQCGKRDGRLWRRGYLTQETALIHTRCEKDSFTAKNGVPATQTHYGYLTRRIIWRGGWPLKVVLDFSRAFQVTRMKIQCCR